MKDIYDLLSNGKKNIYKSHFKKQSKMVYVFINVGVEKKTEMLTGVISDSWDFYCL